MIYPIGIQNFESLRNDGYTYVDKTAQIYQLATTGRYYFLSRPRRFGKSLLISTMEAYFSGRKDLFEGLALSRLEQTWTKYPVLHLDLNTGKYETEGSLDSILNDTLMEWEKLYGNSPSEVSLELRFKGIVRRASEQAGERVVILVDEYDKPMLQAIGNDALQAEFRSTLKAFYSVLKTQDRYIKFAFFTGVTKFGKVSVFCDLNNLNDISMDNRYSDICGITEEELHTYFSFSVQELAEAQRLSVDEAYAKLKEQYDGYCFHPVGKNVYDPFSLLITFDKMKFGDYWFQTGTPDFLVHLLQKVDFDLRLLEEEEVSVSVLNDMESMNRNPISVIYQSGYLTIKGYDKTSCLYRLRFPNKEVEMGFLRYLIPYYTPLKDGFGVFYISKFVKDFECGNPEGFLERLQTLFSDTDYHIIGKMEKYFQNALYVIFKMLGFYTEVERTTARGRMDVVLKTKDYIYVMELKLDGSAEEALAQIEEKGYAEPFALDGRTVYEIGINFSSEMKGIEGWKIKKK